MIWSLAVLQFCTLPIAVSVEPLPSEQPGLSSRFSETPQSEEIAKSHLFAEPLVAALGSTPQINARLARALEKHIQRKEGEDFSAITDFIQTNPDSGWNVSLLANLGGLYYKSGRFSKALEAWEQAWQNGKDATDPKVHAVVDEAVGQLAKMNARIGRFERLETLLAELKGREISGPATEMLTGAAEGLWLMKNRPDQAFQCGPMAVGTLFAIRFPEKSPDPRIEGTASSVKGTSLTQVRDLAKTLSLDYQMAMRDVGGQIILPSVIHWKVGHFGCLVRHEDGRSLIVDPTFGEKIWVKDSVLDEESSGYFLVPAGTLPKGWRQVRDDEGDRIWGKGNTGSTDPDATKRCDLKNPPCCSGSPPMAIAQTHLAVVSLNIVDTPFFSTPPKGLPIRFTATYNQRDANQPGTFSYSNLGPKWTCDWISYVVDDPTSMYADVRHYLPGGGVETHTGYSSASLSFEIQRYSQARLVRTSSSSYERRLPDGSKEVFDYPDGTTGSGRKVFLRQIIDASGNSLNFTFYSGTFKLWKITDALGRVTTLSYGLVADPLKITRVEDQSGRFATFDYLNGHLSMITDMVGI